MTRNLFAPFFAAYNASVKRGNQLTKEELIGSFTGGATTSLKDLSRAQLNELTTQLRLVTQTAQVKTEPTKADRMRKAIIAIFKSMGRTTTDAIAWAEKQGVRGEKKGFNSYTTGELYVLIQLAEKIKLDQGKALRTSLKTI